MRKLRGRWPKTNEQGRCVYAYKCGNKWVYAGQADKQACSARIDQHNVNFELATASQEMFVAVTYPMD